MAKRRSSTRLPRRPKLLASLETPAAASEDGRIEYAPVVVMGRVLRRVHERQSLQFVEEWNGEYWFPSGIPMHIANTGSRATPEQLRARGVPPEDWRLTSPSSVPAEPPETSASDIDSSRSPPDRTSGGSSNS